MVDYSGIVPGSIESYYNRYDPNARRRLREEAERFQALASLRWEFFPRGPVQEKQGLMLLSALGQFVIPTCVSLFFYFRYGVAVPIIQQDSLGGTLLVFAAIVLPAAWFLSRVARIQLLLRREKRHDFLRFKRKYPRLASVL
jgi:hypothetical protein